MSDQDADLTLPEKGIFAKSSFKFSRVMHCNQFSNEAKLAKSIPSFKRLIRKWLGPDKMYIFIAVNFYLFYYYHYYYCQYLLLLLLL